MRLTSLLLAAFLSLTVARAEVRLVGSDLLGKDFTTALAAYSKRNDLGIKLALEGSRAGMEQLQSGRADLGLMVFSPGEKPPEAPYVVLPVAYHTLAVVVPATLPLSQITFGQLNTIYGDDAQSGLKRWSDLGVTGEWANRNILPNITGPGGGITYDLFRYTVLAAPSLKPTVGVQTTLSNTLTRIRGDEGGIAVLPLMPATQTRLKTLLVARGAQDVAFGPTPENLHSGDYPVRLPVYLVFRKDAAKQLQTTLRYLLSEEAVPLWEGAQLVPLPIQARNQMIFDLEVL
ncbi:PstS family phosphate ABC transporter substrate-binding protein [Rariglobus hedericola]|uniref:Phosphate ABC transporter substrate-binding protein n=1 Tax=Rariglobus hedericola TaxID=2597822 RepID=A0A556QMA1_9BACT|nr:substrate-binding domain-containing protein [Rariglobus hedericola]TSJ77780.1 phosphate ABC transporter substrate-binding protein [Rariglobus hedericola]